LPLESRTNHGNDIVKFWAEMDKYVGDGKKLKREVGEYRIGIGILRQLREYA
jgi:hypothetical protein